MDSIVLFSHGSLLCGAGVALSEHASELRQSGLAPIVEIGYLNYTEPSFPDAVAACVSRGADRVIVAPYFLAPGYFVNVDLPRVVAEAQVAHPDVTFVVAQPIGYDALLADAICDSAANTLPRSEWRSDLKNASDLCSIRPECPLYGSTVCRACDADARAALLGATTGEAFERERVVSRAVSNPGVDPTSSADSSKAKPREEVCLLVMVHGSPRSIANDDMFRVVKLIEKRNLFRSVQVGFMECNSPDIPSAIEACVDVKCTEVIAVPYFLHTGMHVADDLPTLIEDAEEIHPEVSFRMGRFLGRSKRLTQILVARIVAAM